jgi:hypothetical protein
VSEVLILDGSEEEVIEISKIRLEKGKEKKKKQIVWIWIGFPVHT